MLSGVENPVHWLIVIVIALIVLGPKRLPEVGRSLGNGIRSFREAMSDGGDGEDEGERKRAPLSEADAPDGPDGPEAAGKPDAPDEAGEPEAAAGPSTPTRD